MANASARETPSRFQAMLNEADRDDKEPKPIEEEPKPRDEEPKPSEEEEREEKEEKEEKEDLGLPGMSVEVIGGGGSDATG